MSKNLRSVVFRYWNRAGVIYALIFTICFLTMDFATIKLRTTAATLSRLMPDFQHLLDIQDKNVKPDPHLLDEYLLYFNKLNVQIAPRPDTYSLLGFCYYHLGQTDKAITYYNKAIKLYSNFFWFHYDLGVIYYRSGRYEDAARSFLRALKVDLFNTLNFLTVSRTYLPMINNGSEDMQEFLRKKLQKGYRNCYALLIMTLERNSQFNDIHRLAVEAVGAAVDDDGFFSYYAGWAAFQLGLTGEASYFLEQCLRKNPNYTQAYFLMSALMKKGGREDLAVRFLKESTRLQQNHGEYHFPTQEARLQVF